MLHSGQDEKETEMNNGRAPGSPPSRGQLRPYPWLPGDPLCLYNTDPFRPKPAPVGFCYSKPKKAEKWGASLTAVSLPQNSSRPRGCAGDPCKRNLHPAQLSLPSWLIALS